MRSPLNIEETAGRYGLNEESELKEELIALDHFIWQNCEINTVDDLVAVETQYQELGKNLNFCFDSEAEDFSPVNMCDGEMCLLEKGAFQRSAKGNNSELFQKFVAAGLSDLETVVVITFLAEISGLYRKDAYHHGVPPFVLSVCEILNSGISKLPAFPEIVVRVCNDYDKADLHVGDVFSPGYCLTCSADICWENTAGNRYKITPLDAEHTKARNLFCIHNISEQQVTFLQNAQFRVTGISDWGEGKKQIEMQEF